MKNLTLSLALIFVGATVSQSAQMKVLHTTKTGVPAYDAPGLPGRGLSSTGKLSSSPNGQYYSFVGLINLPTTRVLISGDTVTGTSEITALNGTACPFAPGFNWSSFRSGSTGVDDSGRVIASIQTTEASTVNDYIAKFQIGGASAPAIIAKESGAFFAGTYSAGSGCSPYLTNKVAFQNGPGVSAAPYQGIIRDTTFALVKGTLPATVIGTADNITAHVVDFYRMSPDGSVDIAQGTVGTDTTKDSCLFVNDNMVARESYELPGVVPPMIVAALGGGGSSSAVASNGYYAFRGTAATTLQEFAVIGKVGGGQKVIRMTDPIATGETETWSDTVASVGLAIHGVAVNKWGESVIVGYSSRANTLQDFVIVYDNGFYSQVLVRENDILDVNGDTLLNDDAVIQSVLNDAVTMSDSHQIFVTATIATTTGGNPNGSSTAVGATIMIDYPIAADVDGDGEVGPGDFDTVVAGFGGTGPLGDVDRDGEVGPSDFDIVVAQFGRS